MAIKKTTTKKPAKRKAPARKKTARKKAAPRKTLVLQTVSDDYVYGGGSHRGHAHLSLYRNIALGFFIVTILLFAAIFFTSVRRASINVTYVPEVFRYSDVVRVASERFDENTVLGAVELRDVSFDQEYITETRQKAANLVRGRIRIVNEHSNDQPLVKTTRFLNEDGVLFRLSESVVVPAGGELNDVEVYADEEGSDYEVMAGHFIIPGLWEPLQKKIYGESTVDFSGGFVEIGVITSDDMQRGEAAIREAMIAHAYQTILDESPEEDRRFDGLNVTLDGLSISSDSAIGDTVDRFTLVATAKAIVVRYQTKELHELSRSRISTEPLPEYLTIEYPEDGLSVRVESYDLDAGTAQLSLFAELEKVIVPEADYVSTGNFLGKTKEDIDALLNDIQGLSDVDAAIEFFPYWVKRVPRVGGAVDVTVRAIEVNTEE